MPPNESRNWYLPRGAAIERHPVVGRPVRPLNTLPGFRLVGVRRHLRRDVVPEQKDEHEDYMFFMFEPPYCVNLPWPLGEGRSEPWI
jgi:hypothetical protein